MIILCFGFGACIALSLMMKHVVQVKAKKDVHPALADLHLMFDIQLQRRPKLAIEERDGRRVAILTMNPSEVVGPDNVPRLAQTVGRYLSQCRDEELQFEALVVVAKSTTGGEDRRFDIPVLRNGGLRTGWRGGAKRKQPKPGAARKPSVPVKPGTRPAKPAPTSPTAPKTKR